MTDDVRFDYRSAVPLVAICCVAIMVLGFAGAAFFETHPFAPGMARLLRGLVVVTCIVTPVALWLAYRRYRDNPRTVVLGAEGITAPANAFARGASFLRYDEIERIYVVGHRRAAILRVEGGGTAIGIPDGALDGEAAFRALHGALTERVKGEATE